MQNTTTSKEMPDKLIENFFITGVCQETLMCQFKKERTIQPQVLFSMFTDDEQMQKYNQFVFPNKIEIQLKEMPPCFQTFTLEDEMGKGNQSFFHCFIFHEKLNEYQILNNYDYEGIDSLIAKRRKVKHSQQDDDISDTTTVYEQVNIIKNQERKQRQERATTRRQPNKVKEVLKKMESQVTNPNTIEDQEVDIQKIKDIEKMVKQQGMHSPSRISYFGNNAANKTILDISKSNQRITNFNMNDVSQNLRVQQSTPHFDLGNYLNKEMDMISDNTSMVSFLKPQGTFVDINRSQSQVSIDQNTKEQLTQIYYVPVAFVINTKVEFHDAFKLILTSLYESISTKLKEYHEKDKKLDQIPNFNEMMAYTEMIQHIAMLRTIPAPVFNSEINLHFYDVLINLKENSFNELPHKNQDAIKTLMEVLDFKTILTCLKALLFDRSLIVMSSNIYLLFQVVEGIKQLMFPFTFDYKQFLYANQNYVDPNGGTLLTMLQELEGMQPVIFAIQTPLDREQYNSFFYYPNAVALDIDCSHCIISPDQEEEPMPPFPNEIELLKNLYIFKNTKMPLYGKVYPEKQCCPEEYDEENYIINRVRETIFRQCFLPFLLSAYKTINPKKQNPKSLNDYWNQETFLEHIEENFYPADEYYKFGQSISKRQSFAHFLDGYLDDNVVNFDLCNSILCRYGLLSKRYKNTKCTLFQDGPAFQTLLSDENIQSKLKIYIANYSKHQVGPRFIFDDEVVRFNFQIPSYHQRQMLLEKISYLVEHHKEKIETECKSSRTKNESIKSDQLAKNKKIKYQHHKIIHIARNAYQKLMNQEQSSALLQQEQQKQLDSSITPKFQSFKKRPSKPLAEIVGLQLALEPTATFGPQELDASALTDKLILTQSMQKRETMQALQPPQGNPFGRGKQSQLDVNTMDYIPEEEFDKVPDFEVGQSQYLLESARFQIPRGPSEALETTTEIAKKSFSSGVNMKKNFTTGIQQNSSNFLNLSKNNIQFDELFVPKEFQREETIVDNSPSQSSYLQAEKNLSIMYGKKGLLKFLGNLFIHFTEKDKQKINFYFTIRNQIIEFVDLKNNYNKNLMKSKELREIFGCKDPNGQLCQPNRMMTILKKRDELQNTNQSDALRVSNIAQVYSNNMLFKSQMTSQMQNILQRQNSRKISFSGLGSLLGDNDNFSQSQDELNLTNAYDENQWFWIESNSSAMKSNSSQNEQSNQSRSVYQTLSYQEVLYFIKIISTFEDKKYLNQMILQLTVNFPMLWKALPKEILELKRDSFFGKKNNQNEPYIYSKFEILGYMFPLNKFQISIDTMSRQEIINLGNKLFEPPEKKKSRIPEQIWDHLDYEYSQNDLTAGRLQEIPTYKDLIKFMITKKYLQTLQAIKEDENTLHPNGNESKEPSQKLEVIEVIDESLFTKFSLAKHQLENKKQSLKINDTSLRSSSLEMPTKKNLQSCAVAPSSTKHSLLQKIKFNFKEKIKSKHKITFKEEKKVIPEEKNSEDQLFDDDNYFDYLLQARDRQTLERIQSRAFHDNKKCSNPILMSVKLLKEVVAFWVKDYNQCLMQKYANQQKQKLPNRIKMLEKMQRCMQMFENTYPDFTIRDDQDENPVYQNFCDEQYASLGKQCFYVNIYNALILFKMAELATFSPISLFKLKNYSSWLALEHNVSINISHKTYTAYQIKNEIVLKIKDTYLHSLIDFAFFLPKGGNLKLADVCFNNIYALDGEFTRKVKVELKHKIHMKSNYSLIVLPECLKQVLPSCHSQSPKHIYNTLLAIRNKLSDDEDINSIINQIRAQLDERQENVEKKEYIISFQPHNQAFKKNQITKGLEQKYRELEKEARKEICYYK